MQKQQIGMQRAMQIKCDKKLGGGRWWKGMRRRGTFTVTCQAVYPHTRYLLTLGRCWVPQETVFHASYIRRGTSLPHSRPSRFRQLEGMTTGTSERRVRSLDGILLSHRSYTKWEKRTIILGWFTGTFIKGSFFICSISRCVLAYI